MQTYTQEEAALIVRRLSKSIGDICSVSGIDYKGMNSTDAEGMAIGDMPSGRHIVVVYLANEGNRQRFTAAMQKDKGFAALRPLGLVPMVASTNKRAEV